MQASTARNDGLRQRNASKMNLTLQHRNIDFDFSSGGPLHRDGSAGDSWLKNRQSTLPTACRFILALWIPVWVFFLVWPLRKDPSRLANTLQADSSRHRSPPGQRLWARNSMHSSVSAKTDSLQTPHFVWLALTMRRSTRFGPFTFCIPVSSLNTLSSSWSTKLRPTAKTIPTLTLV